MFYFSSLPIWNTNLKSFWKSTHSLTRFDKQAISHFTVLLENYDSGTSDLELVFRKWSVNLWNKLWTKYFLNWKFDIILSSSKMVPRSLCSYITIHPLSQILRNKSSWYIIDPQISSYFEILGSIGDFKRLTPATSHVVRVLVVATMKLKTSYSQWNKASSTRVVFRTLGKWSDGVIEKREKMKK